MLNSVFDVCLNISTQHIKLLKEIFTVHHKFKKKKKEKKTEEVVWFKLNILFKIILQMILQQGKLSNLIIFNQQLPAKLRNP